LVLLAQFHDLRGVVGVLAVAAILGAAALGSFSPSFARIGAIGALLVAPPLVAFATLRWALAEQGWLRQLPLAIGGVTMLTTLVTIASMLFPSAPLARLQSGEQASEASVEVPADVSRFTITVIGELEGDHGQVRLRMTRGGRATSLDVPLERNTAGGTETPEGLQLVRRRIANFRVPGDGPIGVRLAGTQGGTALVTKVSIKPASTLDRYAAAALSLLGSAAIAVQVWAERHRVRSWLLLGSGISIALAAYGPSAYDAAEPAASVLGILAVATLAGGGSALAISYAIAKVFERPHRA